MKLLGLTHREKKSEALLLVMVPFLSINMVSISVRSGYVTYAMKITQLLYIRMSRKAKMLGGINTKKDKKKTDKDDHVEVVSNQYANIPCKSRSLQRSW